MVRTRSYDPISQSLSVLAAHGRGEWIMTVGFVISAACQIVTAVGLRVLRPLAHVALALAGCAGLAVAALPDRLGTATPHIAAAGLAAVLLAVWPVLTVSLDRRRRGHGMFDRRYRCQSCSWDRLLGFTATLSGACTWG